MVNNLSDSVTIKDGVATHRTGAGAQATPEKTGTVVALTEVNDYTNKGKTVISHKAGETSVEERGTERVTGKGAGTRI